MPPKLTKRQKKKEIKKTVKKKDESMRVERKEEERGKRSPRNKNYELSEGEVYNHQVISKL